MSEAATIPVNSPAPAPKSKYWNEEKKKYVITTQFKDENGLPVGPLQYFEADTLEELLEKKDAAHANASVALYKSRNQAKLVTALQAEPNQPIPTFEERQLSADERVRIANLMKDPSSAAEGIKTLIEAQLGAPLDVVRDKLRRVEISDRVATANDEVEKFKAETPDYVECENNSFNMNKYMSKRGLSYTKANLLTAYKSLKASGLLTLRAVTPTSLAPAPAPKPVVLSQPTELRPTTSSSGLRRDNASAAAPTAAQRKTGNLSIRDINKMSAAEYEQRMKDPEFRRQVDSLYERR